MKHLKKLSWAAIFSVTIWSVSFDYIVILKLQIYINLYAYICDSLNHEPIVTRGHQSQDMRSQRLLFEIFSFIIL